MQSIQNLMGGQGQPAAPEEEPNGLEALNEANNAKEVPKSEGDIDSEALIKMMMTGENSNGMFEPDAEEIVEEDDKDKIHEDTTETTDIKTGKTLETSKKYREAMMKDMTKNPDKYKIETPEGEMTIKEALEKGYNPVTKKFEESPHKKNIEESKKQLNDKDRAKLEELTNPANVGLAPADADVMGLPASSPMIAGQAPQAQPQAMPPEAAAMGGGMPMGAQQPGQAAPGQEQQAGGMPDIAALLGGGM